MDSWPFLAIRDAVADCDRTLEDIVRYVETLQNETEGFLPPAAPVLLANVAALRELLGVLLPPALQEAIAAEQIIYDEEEARWEPVNY